MKQKVLVTGGAGFIGSAICDKLVAMEEVELVRVLDNLSTGFESNISHLHANPKFEFMKADIRDFAACTMAMKDIDTVMHQAALGSVPRSVKDPVSTHDVNSTGTLHIFTAAREASAKKVIYASSSSVYGSNADLPKRENKTGEALSPYAVSKKTGELYAQVFASLYSMRFIGFRYFNVFGPRQSPAGAYAAVIPVFFQKMMKGEPPVINGDGSQSRDFTYVANVVDANIAAMQSENPGAWGKVYNIACGSSTSLLSLYTKISQLTGFKKEPVFGPWRAGDIKDSIADVSMAANYLNFEPGISIDQGLAKAHQWYAANHI